MKKIKAVKLPPAPKVRGPKLPPMPVDAGPGIMPGGASPMPVTPPSNFGAPGNIGIAKPQIGGFKPKRGGNF